MMVGRVLGRALLATGMAVAGAAMAVVPSRPAAATPSTGFHVISPVRILDTRGGPGAKLAAGVERSIAVAGAGGVPSGATRAAVRLTFTEAQGPGVLRLHACGAYDPNGVVTLEIVGGVTDTALALPALAAGAFCATSTVATHLVADVEGYEDGSAGGIANVPMGAAAVLEVPIVGVGGVPAGAGAASFTVSAVGDTAGFLTAYPCDTDRPLASTLTYPAGQRYLTAAIGALGASGRLCVYAHTAATVRIFLRGYWAVGATPTAEGPLLFAFTAAPAPGFVAVPPRRLFDTRSGSAVAGGTAYELDLSAAVPASATDVVMNVTVTDPRSAGYVTVYPCAFDRPTVSNLNYVTGQTVPNLVTVSLGPDNRVCLFTSATAELLADLAGWYQEGGGDGLVAVAPTRLFDTRSAGARLGAGATYDLDLTGRIGADASAVVMNVTVTEAGSAGFVTVYPCSSPRPTASNLNYVSGQTVPNLVTVSTGTDRHVCFFTSGPAHLLADLSAWYAPSSKVGYFGLVPERQFDTRFASAVPGTHAPGTPVTAGSSISTTFGPGAIDALADAVVAVVMNVTAVEPVAAGYVTVYPCADGQPTASNVNFVAGQVVPNLTVVRVDRDDKVCFFAQQQTHLIADISGYFSELASLHPIEIT